MMYIILKFCNSHLTDSRPAKSVTISTNASSTGMLRVIQIAYNMYSGVLHVSECGGSHTIVELRVGDATLVPASLL